MFERAVRATVRGFLQWPDLFIFGLLAFGMTLLLDTVISPIWVRLIGDGSSITVGVLVILVQQFLLTFVSMLIAVAAARIALTRMVGRAMSITEGLRLAPLLRPVAVYSALYTAVTSVLIVGYLVLLLGASGLSFANLTTTAGLSGLAQVPTANINPSAACLIILIFLPLFIGWLLANALAAPVIAAESLGGVAVIRRSWRLVTKSLLVVLGLVLTGLALSCVFSLVLSIFVVTPDLLSQIEQGGQLSAAALPEFPPLLSAVLSALLFMVGAIFGAAWYLVAAEAAAPATGLQ